MTDDPALTIATPFIAERESFRSAPYLDSGRVPTIGFGFTELDGAPVTMATPPMDRAEGERRFAPLVAEYMAAVRAMVRAPMTANQCAALTSLCYNIGETALRGSHLLAQFNAGHTQDAADGFRLFVYAKGQRLRGLVTRREAERTMFLTPDDEATTDDLNAAELNRIQGA